MDCYELKLTQPIYDFRDFPENGHFDNDYFSENLEKSYIGRIRKISRIHPCYHFCNFAQFRLKNESFEISRNSS